MTLEENKALFQFRAALTQLLEPLNRYGQREYCDTIVQPIAYLALKLHERLNGKDVPLIAPEITYHP